MIGLSEHEILKRVIFHARQQLRNFGFRRLSPELDDLLRVTTELLLSIVASAEAVDCLLDQPQFTATAPLERAAWEISSEFDFLVARTTAAEDASRSRIHAFLDMSEHAEKSMEASSTLRAGLAEEINAYERAKPALVQEMRALRKSSKRVPWSGKQLMDVYGANDASRSAYKLLSWQSHPKSTGIHGVEVHRSDARVSVVIPAVQDIEAHKERVAWAVGHSLLYVWNTFATIWQLRPIESPWDNAEQDD